MFKRLIIIFILLPATCLATPKQVLLFVPFTSQAPTAEWTNNYYQDGCEEASVLMAIYWTRSKTNTLITIPAAKKDILAMSYFQVKNYGVAVDLTAQDTADRLLNKFYNYKNYKIINASSSLDIIKALENNQLVIAPTNGKLLKNPNFKAGGPMEHMLVIKGYNYNNKMFITNDPGTRNGRDYKYPEKVLFNALREYPTGNHLPIKDNTKKTLIIISK